MKRRSLKLDPFCDRLIAWRNSGLSLADMQANLAELGVDVAISTISNTLRELHATPASHKGPQPRNAERNYKIWTLHCKGLRNYELAERFGIRVTHVQNIVSTQRKRHGLAT